MNSPRHPPLWLPLASAATALLLAGCEAVLAPCKPVARQQWEGVVAVVERQSLTHEVRAVGKAQYIKRARFKLLRWGLAQAQVASLSVGGMAASLLTIFIVPCGFCAVEEWRWKRAQRPPVTAAALEP